MLRIRVSKTLADILSASTISQPRFYSQSICLCKKYKYAIDPKSITSKGSRLSQNIPRKKGTSIVDGKVLTFFALDPITEYTKETDSPKQRAYAEIVHSAVNSLLTAPKAPKEVQDCIIEIVHVEVSSSLGSATVTWRLPEYCETKYTKEETDDILQKHLPQLKLLLPAYSTVTLTPNINFVYDTASEKEKEVDDLLEIAKQQEDRFMKSKDE